MRHDISGRWVLDVVPARTREAAERLWATLPEVQRASIAAVAMDMWEPYRGATRKAVPEAVIVHDKFHCVKELNKAVDLVRRRERFDTLKIDTLKVGRAWAITEAFAPFWDYRHGAAARKFFARWHLWATHSRLVPIIVAAKTLLIRC